jgi:hypothetical protein
MVDAPLPHLDRGLHVTDFLIEIAGLVEEGQLVFQRRIALEPLQDLDVDVERLLDLVLDLEVTSSVFQLGDVQG